MKHLFEVAAGSVTGTEHSRGGKNNQDAFAWDSRESFTLAVVCDGCGSRPHSEVGAKLGAQLMLETVTQQWLADPHLQDPAFWVQVQQRFLAHLRNLALGLGSELWTTSQNYLLFTLLGVLITPETTVIFGTGDGLFAINGQIYPLGPFPGNAPPYLAYGLAPADQLTLLSPEMTTLWVHHQCSTSEIDSLCIGTDGVQDLIKNAGLNLPGKSTVLGELSQFWRCDRYFKNPDGVRRQLALANRETIQPDWSRQQLTRHPGLLPDDTTLITIRRKCVTQGESLGCLYQSTKNPVESSAIHR